MDMIERVARAIYLSPLGGHDDPCAPRWEELREKQKDGFRDNARAAIEAMREPTASMVEKGESMLNGSRMLDLIWDGMIDAALTAPAPNTGC